MQAGRLPRNDVIGNCEELCPYPLVGWRKIAEVLSESIDLLGSCDSRITSWAVVVDSYEMDSGTESRVAWASTSAYLQSAAAGAPAIRSGQGYGSGCSLAEMTFKNNRSVLLLDDGFCDCETEARAARFSAA